MISVLIPSYRPEKYLENCLESLNNQTLPKENFTVYIALNGPKEKYEDYIINLLEKTSLRYEYIYIPESGVSNARNHLINISKEDYICFIDDDDIVSPHYLQKLLLHASEKFISVSNVLSFSRTLEETSKNYIGDSYSRLPNICYSLYKGRKFFSSPWGKLIHRKIVQNTKFDTNLTIGEDSLFMAELSCRVQGLKKTDPLACYYVNKREGSAYRKTVPIFFETKRIFYLLKKYIKLLFSGYDILFIISRIIASIMQLKRLF